MASKILVFVTKALESCNQLTAVEDFLVKYTRNGVLARMGRGG